MKRILFFIDWYRPAKKAGGPIKSLENLIRLLSKAGSFENRVVTSNMDLDGSVVEPNPGVWRVLNYSRERVIYLQKSLGLLWIIPQITNNIKPDILYINGMYSWYFSVYPLVLNSVFRRSNLVIVSPRGMLQEGAMKNKYWRKLFFLQWYRLFVTKNVIFHATSEQERHDVVSVLGLDKSKVVLVNNVPNDSINSVVNKKFGSDIRFVLVSRLDQKKNIDGLIRELKNMDMEFHLDIYGEFISKEYEELVIGLLESLPSNVIVTFHGFVDAVSLPEIFQAAHYFILLTHGENYGHAIFEAFSHGVPVICSINTPWTKDIEGGAGYIWKGRGDLVNIRQRIAKMTKDDYLQSCERSLEVAKRNSNFDELKMKYENLFETTI